MSNHLKICNVFFIFFLLWSWNVAATLMELTIQNWNRLLFWSNNNNERTNKIKESCTLFHLWKLLPMINIHLVWILITMLPPVLWLPCVLLRSFRSIQAATMNNHKTKKKKKIISISCMRQFDAFCFCFSRSFLKLSVTSMLF